MSEPKEFQPDWTVPPGQFLDFELRARGITRTDFAALTGLPPETLGQIISADLPITEQTAAAIGAALGTTPQFWLDAEALYQRDLARGATTDWSGEG